ncbi:hypothetical protein GIB67_030144 [Kingdonia uniflora]|uniref:NAD(P)-binding domain-containing protein n=1 Tax=Kingdonia uniflora TaxID=39325 RepID=A0A7J7LE76_9MAGN|nr:hypothetical protein GIB67_030144 [Kingdonia uniflora]
MAPVSFEQTSKKVCVMDASGRLGSSLVDRLLQRGYIVHAAIQNNGIMNCDNNKKNLRVFRSDPFDYHSIINALRGCSALFYTFEPPQEQPIFDEFTAEEEVRAAHNVLEACAQTETVEKVVFTSSVTAAIWREDRSKSSQDFDERHWSDVNFCRKFKLWHALSKTLAERTAWALAKDRDVSMVSINAGLLLGPELSVKHPYLKGTAEMFEDGVFVTVDLIFLVDAHIAVFEDVSTYGRYFCFNHVINRPEDAVQFAQMLTPSPPPPPPLESCEDSTVHQQRISNKKLNKVMVDYGMVDEEAIEVENDYYQIWRFYHLIMLGEQRRLCLRLLAEDVINEADEEVGVAEEETVAVETEIGNMLPVFRLETCFCYNHISFLEVFYIGGCFRFCYNQQSFLEEVFHVGGADVPELEV